MPRLSPSRRHLRLGALGVEVALAVDEGAGDLLAALAPILTAPSGRPPAASWLVEAEPDGWCFRPGLQAPSSAVVPSRLLGPMLHRLNGLVARQSPAVAVHAGAVAVGDHGMLLTGPADAGKSTLTTGLVLAGASYLGDEAIGVAAGTGRLIPYHKPLTFEPGSGDLFPGLAPLAVAGSGPADPWHVPVDAVRPGALSDGASLARVVFCRYERGATTLLTEVPRAAALYELTALTFRFRDRARLALDTLGHAVSTATCHRLVTGDLDAAVAAVLALAPPVPVGGGHR
jgi:hypothetical protein